MGEISNTLNTGITASELASTIPHVGTLFVSLIIFSIGLMIFRKVLRGARRASPRI